MPLPRGITQDDITKRYAYSAELGEFRWVIDMFGPSAKASCHKGDLAGKWRGNDLVLKVKHHELPARRVAWLLMTGVWPDERIGVVDGDPHNLSWANLELRRHIVEKTRTRTCENCGADFLVPHAGSVQKCCSRRCSGQLRDPRDGDGRKCLGCGEVKSAVHFLSLRGGSLGSRCGDCRSAEQRERRMFDAYGVTPAAFAEMLERQGYVCAICREAPNTDPVVDHDHATGVVRGLLCVPCNLGLGRFEDNAARLRAAAEYLDAAGKT